MLTGQQRVDRGPAVRFLGNAGNCGPHGLVDVDRPYVTGQMPRLAAG